MYITIVGSTIGKLGIVHEEFDGMNLTENAARIIPHMTFNKFMMFTLSSKFIQEQFFGKIKGMAQPKLALKRIETTLFPLPSTEEQRAIVSRIDKIVDYCDQLEQQITQSQTNAELLMQSVLREAFTIS